MTSLVGPEFVRAKTFHEEQWVVIFLGTMVNGIVKYKSRLYAPEELAIRIMERLMEQAVSREKVM